MQFSVLSSQFSVLSAHILGLSLYSYWERKKIKTLGKTFGRFVLKN